MEKLLWRKLWREKKQLLLVWGGILILTPMIFWITKTPSSLIWYGMIQGVFQTTVNSSMENSLQLPGGFYLFPMEKGKKRELVKKKLWISCLLTTVVMVFSCCTLWVLESFLLMKYKLESITIELYWWKYILLFINIFSMIHLAYYYDYLKKTKEGVSEIVVLVEFGKYIVCIIGLFLGKNTILVEWAFYFLFALALFSMDIYYPVKYLKKMINFYADYECSRGIK